MSRKLDTPERTPLSRNVYIYDNDGHILGGVYQNGSLTNLTLYKMCDIIIIASEPFSLFRLNKDGSTGAKVAENREKLLAGSYIALTNDGEPNAVRITNERTLRRIITKIPSSELTPMQKRFRDRVRERDGRCCVVSGIQISPGVDFIILHATYIFPYAHEQAWVDEGLSRWITDQASPQSQGVPKIHSVQNGLLLKLDCQGLFDAQVITVDANDGYKIICLGEDILNLDGRTLDPSCRDPQSLDRVPDELFHWNFRQAVLAIVKGNGQRMWDLQLEGDDPMGDIMEGPDAAEIMEVELFTRLGAGEIDYSAAPEMHSP